MEPDRISRETRELGESQDEEKATPGSTAKDEIISVYEVLVKEDEDAGGEQEADPANPGLSVISALPAKSSQYHRLIQGVLDLDAIDIVSTDGDAEEADDTAATTAAGIAVRELLESEAAEAAELEASQSTVNATEENMVVYSHPVERPQSTNSGLIDKDDPRSRLHYVKYLKRDGKTLKIWECGICTKEFRHQYTLMRHLPTHTDERNFKCDACGKAFRQLSTLSQHKAIHSDARPYVCEFCKKTFNRVSTLISHRKTHSEHKPHKCHLCGKGFHQKGNLRNHIFTHTNERPYKCELCGKGFNQMSNLVCHKVKAHAHAEKMQYTCGICGKDFPRRCSLRTHEECKHGIKYRQPTGAQNTANEPRSSKNKSVRVIHVSEDEQQNSFSDSRDKDMNMTEFMENIIIDKIETKAMETALLHGQTPFALFKPAKGIPVLVKVTSSGSLNHLLTPATADDLKMSGKMDSNSAQLSDLDGSKSVQIKVPVVATVTEKIEADGKPSFIIEPPGPDQDQDSLLTPVDSVSEFVPCDDDYEDGYLSLAGEQLQSQQTPTISMPAAVLANNSITTDDELLELAALGGIQFVRATEDGGYKVMTNSEARDLMAQNSHDVKILEAGQTEAINNVINVDPDLNFLPSIGGPMELQPKPEIILPDPNILVLDPNNDQKALTLGDIEILEDKELRQLLDTKCLEDFYTGDASNVAHFPQVKIDEILNGKPITVDSGAPIADGSMHYDTNQNGIASALNLRSELSSVSNSSIYTRNLFQPQQPYSLPMLPESIPFLKNNQSFNDDLNMDAIFGEDSSSVIDYSMLPEYNPRLKMSELEDDPESIFLNYSQSGAKVIAQKSHGMFDGMNEKQYEDRFIERTIENAVKVVDEKATPIDLSTQFDDLRFLNSYDQFFKNPMYDSHFASLSSFPY